jgi:hypothetical protein
MTIKQDLEGLKQRMFRVETLVWVIAGVNGIKLGADVLPTVAAMFLG